MAFLMQRNDAFVPAYKDGELGFNVLVGGFFSAKRCAAAIPLNAWVPPTDEGVALPRLVERSACASVMR